MGESRSFYTEKGQAVSSNQEEHQLPKITAQEQSAESVLESSIKNARIELTKYFEASKKVYIDQSQRYYEAEREITGTLSSLHDKRESFLPNGIYVLTGGILGSIITRRSNILFRLIAPLAFGAASFKYFMPLTYERTFNFASDVEKSNLPDVYAKQTEMINKAEELAKQTTQAVESQQSYMSSLYESTKNTIYEWTGLNVNQSVTEKKK